MAQHKAPAFQFYAGDFLADDNVCLMTNEQVGAYVLLLCHQWARPEGLPEALSSLAKLARCTTTRFERAIWPALVPCFRQNETQRWFNSRLERVRTEQEAFFERQRAAGRASAAVRAKGQPKVNHGSIPVPTEPQPEPQPQGNSSSSSSSSTSKERERPPTPTKTDEGLNTPDTGTRPQPIFGRRNPDLLTFGPIPLWASQFRDEILPLAATHHGGNRDDAYGPALQWVGELDTLNQKTPPAVQDRTEARRWWSEHATARWASQTAAGGGLDAEFARREQARKARAERDKARV